MYIDGIDKDRIQKRILEKDDLRKEMVVIETDDDKFVVCITIQTTLYDKKGNWEDSKTESKVFVRDENPFDKEEEDKEEEEVTIMDAISNFKFS